MYIKNILNFNISGGGDNMSFIHSTSEVQTTNIGKNICVWQFCVILANAKIGNNCKIGCNVFIENNVKIGNNVTIKNGVQIFDGVTIKDNVFIGANTVFCNDRYPKSNNKNFKLEKVVINENVSIGANVTVLPGVTIGKNVIIGAGSVVTKSVDDNCIVVGNPAKKIKEIY